MCEVSASDPADSINGSQNIQCPISHDHTHLTSLANMTHSPPSPTQACQSSNQHAPPCLCIQSTCCYLRRPLHGGLPYITLLHYTQAPAATSRQPHHPTSVANDGKRAADHLEISTNLFSFETIPRILAHVEWCPPKAWRCPGTADSEPLTSAGSQPWLLPGHC